MSNHQHPFASTKGRRIRDRLAKSLFVAQSGKCKMCGALVNAALRGTKDKRAAVVEHVRPHKLRPDLRYDETNIALVCLKCHNVDCARIEAKHWPYAERIATEKDRQRPVGLDGYRIG